MKDKTNLLECDYGSEGLKHMPERIPDGSPGVKNAMSEAIGLSACRS
jgi:hypothetical protein